MHDSEVDVSEVDDSEVDDSKVDDSEVDASTFQRTGPTSFLLGSIVRSRHPHHFIYSSYAFVS